MKDRRTERKMFMSIERRVIASACKNIQNARNNICHKLTAKCLRFLKIENVVDNALSISYIFSYRVRSLKLCILKFA